MHWYHLQGKSNIKCSAVHTTIFFRWNEPTATIGRCLIGINQSNTRLTFGLLLLGNFAKSSCNIYVAFINLFSLPATVTTKCLSFSLITFSFAWLLWRMRSILASSSPRNFVLNILNSSSSHASHWNRPRRCRGGRDESEGEAMVDFSIFKARNAAIAAFFLASSAVLPAIGSKCRSPTSSSARKENSVSWTWYESREGPSSSRNCRSLRCGWSPRRLASWHGKALKWFLTIGVYGKTKEGRKQPKKSWKITANPAWVSLSSIFWSVAGLATLWLANDESLAISAMTNTMHTRHSFVACDAIAYYWAIEMLPSLWSRLSCMSPSNSQLAHTGTVICVQFVVSLNHHKRKCLHHKIESKE